MTLSILRNLLYCSPALKNCRNASTSQALVKSSSSQVQQSDCEIRTKGSWVADHKAYSKVLKSLLKRNDRTKVYVNNRTFAMLCETLEVNASTCRKIVKQRMFQDCSYSQLSSVAKFLKEKNVTAEHIIRAPWALCQTQREIKAKLPLLLLPNMFENFIDGLGFSLFNANLLERYENHFRSEEAIYPDHRNKIYYIANELNLPVDLLSIKIVRAWPVLHLKRERIDSVMKLLLEYKIKPLDIINDIWVFSHNLGRMEERLRTFSQASDEPPRLWICRCNDFWFERKLLKHKSLSPYCSLKDLLMNELGCDKQLCDFVIKKGFLNNKSEVKLKSNFDALRKGGFDCEYIRNNMYLLLYSPGRLIIRKKLLNDLRDSEPPWYILAATEAKFNEYIKRLS